MKGKEIRWQCSSECCWLQVTLCHQGVGSPRLCREISSTCLRRGSLKTHICHTATHPCSSSVVNGFLNSPARPHYCHRRSSPPFQTLRQLLFLLWRVTWWIEDDRICKSASLLSCIPLEEQIRYLTALCSGYLLSSHHIRIQPQIWGQAVREDSKRKRAHWSPHCFLSTTTNLFWSGPWARHWGHRKHCQGPALPSKATQAGRGGRRENRL